MKPLTRLAVHFGLAALALAALAALGWVVFDSVLMPRVAHLGWPQVVVPDLSGRTPEEAVRLLRDLGLEPTEDPQRRSSESLPADVVAQQRPAPGDSVKVGHVVRFWLSAGPTSIAVPDVSGQDSAQAARRLVDAGLALEDSTRSVFSVRIPAGQTVGTEPAVGTILSQGARVRLVVSAGDSSRVDSLPPAAPDTQKIF